MENSKQLSHQGTDSDNTPIKFWGNISLASLGLLANILLLLTTFQLPETTIAFVARVFHLLVILTTSLVILLTLRGHQRLGAQLAFYTVAVLFAFASFIYAESALSASFSFIIIAAITISQLLPKELRRRSIVITGVTWMIMWVAEWMNPSWRLTSPVYIAGWATSILLALILGVIVIRQSWNRIVFSIRIQITVWTGLLGVFLTIVLVTYSIITARQAAIASAEAEALTVAQAQAQSIAVQLDPPLLTARTMAASLEGVKENPGAVAMTREQVNAMLEKVLEENPSFLGTYTLWEPNAFDGLDAQYANTTMSDNTGRFIPYWVRGDNGAIHVEPLKDYETPGAGDWYLIPRATMKESTFAPLIYPIQGKDVVMASFIMPIVRDNKFYGITGVDAPITFVQEFVDNVHLYNDTANAVLLTDSGTLIAVHNTPGLVNKPATEVYTDFASLQQKIKAGEAFFSLSPDGQYLRVFSPVNIGKTGSHWSLGLVVPFSAITASVTASAIREVVIGLGVVILSLLILWYLTGRIVRPIIELTTVADTISAGNLNAIADVKAPNETGVLAKAFNSMTSQLRNMLDTLEQRVADRTRNLELAAEVGQTVSQVRALDVMLKDAAELILKQFDLYYVQVYLTNPGRTALILKAGTGNTGDQLLARNHQLPLNRNSINGRAALEKRSVVISETAASPSFHPNPLLPDTQSEMAVPLIIGEKVVGVLDMQSSKAGALSLENLVAFEALAAQLAVAIQNAQLLAETVQARAELETQAKRVSRANWSDYLDAIYKPEEIGVVFQQDKVMPLNEELEPKEDALVAPISILGENLGNLVVELDGQSPIADIQELLDAVARQISLQIEELRLIDNAERYRLEAEEAARRTTIEGWKNYIESRSENITGYMYDSNEVKALHEEPENSGLTMPIRVRDEAVGKFSLQERGAQDDQSLDIAKVVLERLGAHIDNLRLYDQSRSALMQSEKLFEASSQLTQATNLQELVATTVATLNITAVNRALLTTFQYGPSGDIEQLTIIGNWWNGSGHEPTPIGIRYPREVMQVMTMFVSPTPVFFNDTLDDERIDSNTMEIVKRLNLRSVAVLPLFSSNKQIGALFLEGEESHKFAPQETRLFSSLAPQIATVVENRLQFEQAQQQAQREAMLNAISQKIQSATSVEAVLQIAARELGRALDASKAVAQLSAFKRNGGNDNNGNGHHQ